MSKQYDEIFQRYLDSGDDYNKLLEAFYWAIDNGAVECMGYFVDNGGCCTAERIEPPEHIQEFVYDLILKRKNK